MKEAQRPTPWKAIRYSAMILGLVSGCTGPLATRSPVEEFASPTKPTLTETLGETAVPTEPIAPTETHTPTPEPTPTLEATATTEPSPTPEPLLGGDEIGVSYYYRDGVSYSFIAPPEITSLLIPTAPEQW